MDRGAWWATVHRVPKSQPQLSMHAHTHNHYTTTFRSLTIKQDTGNMTTSTFIIQHRLISIYNGIFKPILPINVKLKITV